MSQIDIIHGDRRADRRYAFPMEMRFSCRQRGCAWEGTGNTVDLSRGGIRFQTETPPPGGTDVELRLAWPFLLQNVCPLELMIWGKVLRTDDGGTVVLMKKYEFRTCGERSFHASAAAQAMVSFVA